MARNTPPAPPPYQPVPHGSNPYDFIMQPGKSPRKGLAGGSKMQRMIIFGGFIAILVMILVIFVSILGSSNSGLKNDYQNAVQQQAELIRVSDIGTQKARSSSVKNLAINTKLSLTSSQGELTGLAKKAGAVTDAKTIALGADGQTDKALTAAEQSNRFDDVFTLKMVELLNDYQKTLKRLYEQASNSTTKTTLENTYKQAGLLIQNGKPSP